MTNKTKIFHFFSPAVLLEALDESYVMDDGDDDTENSEYTDESDEEDCNLDIINYEPPVLSYDETDETDDAVPAISIANNATEYVDKDNNKWTSLPECAMRGQTPARRIVTQKQSTKQATKNLSVMNTFGLFITAEIKDIIMRETNREAIRQCDKWNEENPNKSKRTWKIMTIVELDAFIGLLLFAGVHRSNGENIHEFWSYEGHPIYRASMSRHRFEEIMKYLRFDDKRTRPNRLVEDKAAHISEIWAIMNACLSANYTPSENLTVDEQLYPYRGKKCPFRQYIPSKPARYGIKFWWLCDSDNCYPINSQMYLGKEGSRVDTNQGSRVVKDLVVKYKRTGRRITMDQFFTSFSLAKELLDWRLTILGTLRSNKRCIPQELKSRRAVDTSMYAFHKEMTLVSYIPKENKNVFVLSTYHNWIENVRIEMEDWQIKKIRKKKAATLSKRLKRPVHLQEIEIDENDTFISKPEMILNYNETKAGVDGLDQMIGGFTCKRASSRWPMAVFFNMLDVSGVASYLIYRMNWPSDTHHAQRRNFLKSLAKELCNGQILKRKNDPNINCRKSTKHALSALFPNERGVVAPIIGRGDRHHHKPILGRCSDCVAIGRKNRKTRNRCISCEKLICLTHATQLHQCTNCILNDDD